MVMVKMLKMTEVYMWRVQKVSVDYNHLFLLLCAAQSLD